MLNTLIIFYILWFLELIIATAESPLEVAHGSVSLTKWIHVTKNNFGAIQGKIPSTQSPGNAPISSVLKIAPSHQSISSLTLIPVPVPSMGTVNSPQLKYTSSPSASSTLSRVPSSPHKPSPLPTGHPSWRPSSKPNTKKPTSRPSSKAPSTIPTKSPSLIPSTSRPSPKSTPSLAGGSITYANDIHYHANESLMTGPVSIYTTFLGDFSSPEQQTTVSLMNYLVAHIGNSSWYDIMTRYYQVNAGGTRTHASPNVRLAGSVNLHAGLRRQNYSDYAVIQDLSRVLASDFPFDPAGIYLFVMRGDWNYAGWLGQWCGFHTTYPLGSGKEAKIIVIGDPATAPSGSGASCESIIGASTANGNLGADSMATVFAHELVETVTDSFGAWYFDDPSQGDDWSAREECADACVWQFGTDGNSNVRFGEKSFLVQEVWVPKYGCRLST